jgi:hypothetical protein
LLSVFASDSTLSQTALREKKKRINVCILAKEKSIRDLICNKKVYKEILIIVMIIVLIKDKWNNDILLLCVFWLLCVKFEN